MKYEISIHRHKHNSELIDFRYSVVDQHCHKFGSDTMLGIPTPGGDEIYHARTVERPALFLILAQKTRYDARNALLASFLSVHSLFGGHFPNKPPLISPPGK